MALRKILNFNSPREDYIADCCVVWCFDDRFTDALEAYLSSRHFRHADPVRLAGGAKDLIEDGPKRKFILDQIRLSMKLHDTKETVLMLHEDCGANGGSEAFDNDHDVEFRSLEEQAVAAGKVVKQEIPEMEVNLVVLGFDGVHAVESEKIA